MSWEAQGWAIKQKTGSGSNKSILICLDGSPVVNDKTLSIHDYDELSAD